MILAVLGPNGAGKTTFVRCIATLLQPDAGTLRVFGHDVAREPHAVRSSIGLAGQFAAVEPAMTGRENLEMVARLFGQDRAAARANSTRVLGQLGLSEDADRLVRTYSGGMRRKLDLGASLVGAPRLLLLDEPTTGLDPGSRIDLWEAIRQLVDQGTNVLLTTQYLDEADRLADQIVIIDHGRAIEHGTPAELKQRAGSNVIEIHVRDRADLAEVARALTLIGNGEARVDASTHRVTVAVDGAPSGSTARCCRSSGAPSPSRRCRCARRGSMRRSWRSHAASQRRLVMASAAAARPSLASSTAVIAERSLRRFLRTPQLLWTATIQGVMFLVIFRFIFGGAIGTGGLGYVDFVVPGIVTTMLIWQGMGAAISITEDRAQGLLDRLRSLPIPRGAVLAGRALADTAMQVWGLLVMTMVSFLVGFRLHGGIAAGVLAFALVVVFSFVFVWVFMATGLYAANAQAAQGLALILVPFTFVSSAYVPASSMPGWLRAVAAHQPVTCMIEAVRALTGGARAEALLGHPASWFVARSLLWSAVILLVFGAIAVARYRRG